MTMLTRLAATIFTATLPHLSRIETREPLEPPAFADLTDEAQALWREIARKALMEAREPTEAMCAEHADYVSPEFSEHVRQGWRAMIDAALSEST